MTYTAPASPRFELNDFATQRSETPPDAALLKDGTVVLGTRVFDSGFKVAIAKLSADGTEILRNEASVEAAGQINNVSVAGLSNGRFVAVWSELNAASDFTIKAQLFRANGGTVGDPFEPFDTLRSDSFIAEVEPLTNGGFVVAGFAEGAGYVRSFRNSGAALDDAIAVPELSSRNEIVLDPIGGGRLLVTASSSSSGTIIGKSGGVLDQKLSTAFAFGSQKNLAAEAMSGNRTIVVATAQSGIQAKILDRQGNQVTGPFTISEPVAGTPVRPHVERLADNSLVVSWTIVGDGNSSTQLRRLDADGALVGPVEEVPSGPESTSNDGTLLGLENGDFVLTKAEFFLDEFTVSDSFYQVFTTEMSDTAKVGTNRADVLNGGKADNVIVGLGGKDQIDGRNGDDVVSGGGGNDRIVGGGGDDWLRGNAGNDRMFGGTGDDTLRGNDGRDRLLGEDGNDLLMGQDGNDVLQGGDGSDSLFGEAGDDTLNGGKGRDILKAGEGDNVLNGGGGADELILTLGNSTAKGGAGADTFIFLNEIGNHTISDFDVTADVLDFEDLFFTSEPSPEDFVARFAQVMGGNTLIQVGSTQVTLTGVDDLTGLADQIDTGFSFF